MEAFGQCIRLAFKAKLVTLWSWVREEKTPASSLFLILCSAWKTLPSSCELRPSDLRCKDSSVQSDRTGSDKEQALASTSNCFYLQWPDVSLSLIRLPYITMT
ncbi:uncharacterized [Lates japonicus]